MIRANLKVVAILTGLQAGYIKFCCFPCLWDSLARHSHYKEKVWPKRGGFTVGLKNVANPPLVSPNKIILPPLHIKLGLIKQFVKAIDKDCDAINFLKTKFPKLSSAKVTGVFIGPQLRQLLLY